MIKAPPLRYLPYSRDIRAIVAKRRGFVFGLIVIKICTMRRTMARVNYYDKSQSNYKVKESFGCIYVYGWRVGMLSRLIRRAGVMIKTHPSGSHKRVLVKVRRIE